VRAVLFEHAFLLDQTVVQGELAAIRAGFGDLPHHFVSTNSESKCPPQFYGQMTLSL